jgi:glyoxylase-like metal-dependent hydrolase (beta-lactamase superfamily II)
MNRRTFLLRSGGLAAAGLFSRSMLRAQSPGPATAPKGSSTAGAEAPAPARPPLGPPITEFKPLRRNVGIFTGRGGTIGWLASSSSLMVIDTQFPDTAAACLAGLPGRDRRTLDVVLNTHHHFDHTSGNPVFKPAARTIVAQANVPKLQFAAAEKAGNLDTQVFADTTFADVWRHEAGDEVVMAQYFGPAHTNGDSVMIFEKANVVHMGDLVFNRLYPYVDRPGGASVRGWVKRLEEIHGSFPADAIYIFGHGNSRFGVTGTRDDLLVMRDLLSALLERVEKGLAAGQTKDQITALENLPGFPDFHVPAPNRLTDILGTVYAELTAADPGRTS